MGSQVVTLSAPVFLVYSFSTSVLLLLIGVYQVWHTDVYLPRLYPLSSSMLSLPISCQSGASRSHTACHKVRPLIHIALPGLSFARFPRVEPRAPVCPRYSPSTTLGDYASIAGDPTVISERVRLNAYSLHLFLHALSQGPSL